MSQASLHVPALYSWFFSSTSPFWRRWVLGILLAFASVLLHWTHYAFFIKEQRVAEFHELAVADGGFLAPEGILPLADPDGAKWSLQVIEAFRTGDWSLSESAVDAVCAENGPTPVYWARGYFFYLAGLAGILQLFGLSLEVAVAWAAFFSGPLLLSVTLVVVSGLALRVLPGVWGLFLAPLLFFEPKAAFYFSAYLPDHHGMIALSVMIWVLAFFLPSPRGWVVSGAALGVSIWLSALTTIPLLGCFGVGALVSCASGRPWVADPKVFRKWCSLAAGVALLLWVFDYLLVGRAGMRLEIVHPLWVFAIWGGGELLFRISLLLEGKIQPGFLSPSSSALGWILASLAIFAPVFSIIYSGGSWFWPAYPWVSDLMEIISELQPVSLTLILFGSGFVPLVLLYGLAGFWGRSWVAGFAFSSLLCFSMLAFQSRWVIFATFFGVFALLLILSELSKGVSDPPWFHRLCVRISAGSLLLVAFFVGVPNLVNWVNLNKGRDMLFSKGAIFDRPLDEARLSAALRADHGGPGFVILGVSDAGTRAAYYGGGRTVGSVYWEAWRGLKDSAAFWGAQADFQAWEVLDRYGVNYVVFREDMVYSFSGGVEGMEGPTVQQRIVDGDLPSWLVPLDWKSKGGVSLKIFRVERSSSQEEKATEREPVSSEDSEVTVGD